MERGKERDRERESQRAREPEGLIRLLLRPKSPLPIGLVLPEAATFPNFDRLLLFSPIPIQRLDFNTSDLR